MLKQEMFRRAKFGGKADEKKLTIADVADMLTYAVVCCRMLSSAGKADEKKLSIANWKDDWRGVFEKELAVEEEQQRGVADVTPDASVQDTPSKASSKTSSKEEVRGEVTRDASVQGAVNKARGQEKKEGSTVAAVGIVEGVEVGGVVEREMEGVTIEDVGGKEGGRSRSGGGGGAEDGEWWGRGSGGGGGAGSTSTS